MVMSGTLQSVNKPYSIVHIDETYPINTGIVHRGEPMWVIADTAIVLDWSKISVILKRTTANQLVYECNMPKVAGIGVDQLCISIHDVGRKVNARVDLIPKTNGRCSGTVILDNLSTATEYRLYYTVSLKSSEEPLLKHIQLRTETTKALEVSFMPQTTRTITNGEFSFNVRTNHAALSDIVSRVTVHPFGNLSNRTITKESNGIFKINGWLSELHHQTSVWFTVWADGASFSDKTIMYKCLTCVEELILDYKSSFDEIVIWSRTNYAQRVTYFAELYSGDERLHAIESTNQLTETFTGLRQDTVYSVRAWAVDEFDQSSQTVCTIRTTAYQLTHVKVQFTHPELTYGSKPTKVHFVANGAFEKLSLCFKTVSGEPMLDWHNVPFTRNDVLYQVDVNDLEMSCESMLIDDSCDLELYVQGTTSSGNVVELSTLHKYRFCNDRSPPCGEVKLRQLACACTYASLSFLAYEDHKRIPMQNVFAIRLDSPSVAYKPEDERRIELNQRIDFQKLLPDTPYTTVVSIRTVSTQAASEIYPTTFRTMVDPEYIVFHSMVRSSFTCTAIFEGMNRARVVVRLNASQTYMVKRGSVIQLNFKPGKTVLLHTTSKYNHYILTMSDGTHPKLTQCVFSGLVYETQKAVAEQLMSKVISY